jgi:hypothetical protein
MMESRARKPLPALELEVPQEFYLARLTLLVVDRFWIDQMSDIGFGEVPTFVIAQTILSS